MNRETTQNAVEIMHRKFIKGSPARLAKLAKERENNDIAQQIYDLRMQAGLTQAQLAKKVGTTPSVICRLEDADYSGHSLTMLRRIASALQLRLEIRMVPDTQQLSMG